MSSEEKRKKKKILPFILIPVVLLLVGTGILLGVKGKEWFGKEPVIDPVPEDDAKPGDLYWNVEKNIYAFQSLAGMSSREPDKDDDYYHVLFATNGRQVQRRVKDYKVVNLIDSNDVMSLEFDEDGIVTGIKTVEETGRRFLCKDFFVEKVDGTKITLNSSDSFMGESAEVDLSGKLSSCFNVSAAASFCGEQMRLDGIHQYDLMTVILDKNGDFDTLYLTYSNVKETMYWNVDRQYDSELKKTTRVPNAEGVYELLMAANGEQVIVKTKNYDVANTVDCIAAKSCGFKFDEEGFAIEAVQPPTVTHGKSIASWYDVFEFDGKTFLAEKTLQAADTGKQVTGTLAKNCEIYDVSGMGEYIGVPAELRVTDRIQGYTNQAGEVVIIYIVSRKVQAELYWLPTRMYDSKTKQTTRVKAADGYYHVKLCHNGKGETLRTNDTALMSKLDSLAHHSAGLEVEGDIITAVYDATNVYSSKGSWYDVRSWSSQDHTLFHVKKMVSASDTGTEYDIKMAEGCKVYNVTETYVNNMGEETDLRIGDRIQAWCDLRGNAVIIYVVNRDAKNPVTAHKTAHTCKECGENVTWTPWTEGTKLPTTSGHYYLTGNVACPQQNIKENQHVVLCLNGYNVRATGKRIYATYEKNSSLVLDDCTGKGRMYSGYEGDMGTTQGVIAWVRYGSLKVYGGNYDVSNLVVPGPGNVFAAQNDRIIEIYGGKIIGGTNTSEGGAVAVIGNGKLVLKGGQIIAGTSKTGKGDAVFMGSGSTLVVGGSPVVTGKTTCVYLSDGAKIHLDGIQSGAKMGVTLSNGSGIFTDNYEEGAEKCFTSDNKAYALEVIENRLMLTAGSELHEHCVCGGNKADDAHECDDVKWLPWTSDNALPKSTADDGIHYYLTKDVVLTTQQMIEANTHIFLCLNGHKVTMNHPQQRMYSTFDEGSELTITDCAGTGTFKTAVKVNDKTQQGNILWVRKGDVHIYGGTFDASEVETGGTGAAICVDAGYTLDLYNGTIIGGKSMTNASGAVYLKGTVNMYNGVIKNGTAKYGGNVVLDATDAKFNLYDGEISGGKSIANNGGGQGGNIAINAGIFTMNGGVIKNGESSGNHGGNVAASGANAYFTMNDGTITGGKSTAAQGANIAAFYQTKGAVKLAGGKVDGYVFISTGWLTLANDAKVLGGATNIYLNNGIKLVLSNLTSEASFGLTMVNPGQFTNATQKAFAENFVSDNSTYSVLYAASGLYLGIKIPVTSVTVENLTVKEGLTNTLTVTVLPADAYDSSVTYEIEDTTIATVSEDGVVTGVSAGETTVTVTAVDGGLQGTATITVAPDEILPTAVTLNKTTASIECGETETLTATVSPENVTDNSVTWSTSDESVATVADGVVTAVSAGTATITATSSDATVYAECTVTVTAHTHCVCGEALSVNGHTCAGVVFKKWTSTTTLPTEEGAYYLANDVTTAGVQYDVPAGVKITICLNGHTITRSNAGRVIALFNNNSTLTLTDCAETAGKVVVKAGSGTAQGTGIWIRNNGGGNVLNLYRITVDGSAYTLTNANASAVQVDANGKMNLYSGTIIGGQSAGGATVFANGSVDMYGGTITGGKSKYGGNIVLNNTATVFNMYGGEITNGKSTADNGGGQGGNVAINAGTFNMYGGEIKNGTAQGNVGGNVALSTANSYFNLYDGKISGGTCTTNTRANNIAAFYQAKGALKIAGGTVEGGVLISTGWVTLQGSPKITGGATNLTLGNAIKAVASGLTDGAKIGISMTTPGYFTNAINQTFTKYFESDDENYEVAADGTGLKLEAAAVGHKNHCVCGGELELDGHTCEKVTWTEWTSTTTLPNASGNYYLSSDVDLGSVQYMPDANVDVKICLNGHIITTTTCRRVISVHNAGTKITITDCSKTESGAITVKAGDPAAQGAAVWVRGFEGTEFNLYKGTVDASKVVSSKQHGAGVQVEAKAVFNMYGGKVLGGKLTGEYYGSAINNLGTTNIYGGEIYGLEAKKGGAIYVSNGAVNMYGGKIVGGNATEGGAVRVHVGKFLMEDGEIVGGKSTNGGSVFLNINTTFTMNGGVIRDGEAETNGGNVYMNAANTYAAAKFIQNGGEISGGKAKIGGNVFVGGSGSCISEYTMNGGVIKNGTSIANAGGGQGGNVTVAGKFILNGGEIKDGHSEGNGGGNVAVASATSKFIMNGGLVTGGTASTAHAGGIFVFYQAGTESLVLNGGEISGNDTGVRYAAGTVKIAGTPVVKNNNGEDFYIDGQKKITLGTLSAGCEIGIFMPVPGVFAENVATDVSSYFKAPGASYAIAYDNAMKTLSLVEQ